jgi:hypothetical protein
VDRKAGNENALDAGRRRRPGAKGRGQLGEEQEAKRRRAWGENRTGAGEGQGAKDRGEGQGAG